jgi:CubicO group peptidase (beta-lactamase class C family)
LKISLQLYDTRGAAKAARVPLRAGPRKCRFTGVPDSTSRAGGNSGQFVVVIPEEELVVVRLGLTLNESQANMDGLLNDLLERIR